MRPVLLAVARDALKKLLAFLRRLDADAQDMYFPFEISFPFINKGRHLGPAPRSPPATVEKYHRRRRVFKNRGKVDGGAVDVVEHRRGKLIADCQLSHDFANKENISDSDITLAKHALSNVEGAQSR
jgi:hypothetical protein